MSARFFAAFDNQVSRSAFPVTGEAPELGEALV
jgi:hypothetical protein